GLFGSLGFATFGGSRFGTRRRGRKHDGFSASFFDLFRRALREPVRRDGDGLGEIAVAEDLEDVEAAAYQAVLAERRRVHLGAGVEAIEVADVHVSDDRAEGVLEAALGQATLEGRLAALEVQLVDVALGAR